MTEEEFSVTFKRLLDDLDGEFDFVTGPGRSGAVASVYASHHLGVPFLPYGLHPNVPNPRVLVVDTARQSGRTLRKATRKYDAVATAVAFEEPPRVDFWYEKN